MTGFLLPTSNQESHTMIITQHGKTAPILKGVAIHSGKKLVFFAWDRDQLMSKERAWLAQNGKARQRSRPMLRLVGATA